MIFILGLLIIAQVEYQGQTRYNRILDSKPFINGHSLEFKYFQFAQFLLIAHRALITLRKVKIENLKFWTDVPKYGWLVSNTVDDYFKS